MRRDNTISFSSSSGFKCFLNYSLILTHSDTPEIDLLFQNEWPESVHRPMSGHAVMQSATERYFMVLCNPVKSQLDPGEKITSDKRPITFPVKGCCSFCKMNLKNSTST